MVDELREILIDYCVDVLNDEPLTCQKHKWACERFLYDLEREGTEEFPYIFKPEKAVRFIEWCKFFKHTKGILKGKPIILEDAPILLFIASNIYGWYNMNDGYRRFDKLYWQVARKNAKSQFNSLLASYELAAFDETGEEMNEIYCAATKSEQAKIVYDETKTMIRRSAALNDRFRFVNFRITHIKSDSFMRVLTEEDRKSGDGLNPQYCSLDEFHAHPTMEIYDVVEDGMSARTQPLLSIITTAGADLNAPCYRVEYNLVTNILDPDQDFTMENYFVMINELDKDENGDLIDDIKDPSVWIKANPIICSYPEGVKRIEKKLKESLEAPEKMRNFLTKRMNIWVHLTEVSFMSSKRWANCYANPEEWPELKNLSVYIGIDFASKIDLASVAIEIPIDDKYYIMGHSFMCEETFETKKRTDKVPYDLWAQQGWITIQSGAVVDYRKAIEQIKRDYVEKFDWYVQEWCLDPWCASQIIGWLTDDGEKAIEVRQGPRTLSEPTKDLRDMTHAKRIVHDGNPVIMWAVGNAIADSVDRNKNIILNKDKSPQRIDPIAAVVNAHTRAMHSEVNHEPEVLII